MNDRVLCEFGDGNGACREPACRRLSFADGRAHYFCDPHAERVWTQDRSATSFRRVDLPARKGGR